MFTCITDLRSENTHTHTYIYIYIYMFCLYCNIEGYNEMLWEFLGALLFRISLLNINQCFETPVFDRHIKKCHKTWLEAHGRWTDVRTVFPINGSWRWTASSKREDPLCLPTVAFCFSTLFNCCGQSPGVLILEIYIYGESDAVTRKLLWLRGR
jgi:hypothetical protein